MTDGHSTARSLSRSECLNEWITHPSGTLGFSHLLMAAGAELALLDKPRLYLANRKPLPVAPSITLEAAHRASPTNGTHLFATFGFKSSPRMWGDIYMGCFIIQTNIIY